jgi:polysaccharide pyruvyl transferase WcaK-like protein
MNGKKILFTGYYGQKNIGDDIFGIISILGSKKYWNNSKTSLFSAKGPSIEKINIPYSLPKKQRIKGELRILSYFEIIRSKYVILSGGSILHSIPPLSSARRFSFFLSKINFLKMGAIGVSLGPFKSDIDYTYTKLVLQKFKFLSLRDKTSYEIACKMNLPYKPIQAADLAFMLKNLVDINESTKEKEKIKTIGVSLCHYERYQGKNIDNEKRREVAIFDVLNELKKNKQNKFRFFVINGNRISGDEDLILNIINQLSLDSNTYEVIPYTPNTLEIYKKIMECDLMFSTRLHGAILAAVGDVPSILVEYHLKCRDYLDDIGVKKEWRVGDMDKSNISVLSIINKLLKKTPSDFYSNREVMFERSLENFCNKEILSEIL